MVDASPIRDHVVVDGSNIATEGRTLPSLAQLDEAVRAFLEEYPGKTITVVVDATFAHRIDASERDAYEQAVLAGELVAPPAGAVGRGDAFITAIANKAGATILTNDSFQELHGEYPWLFDTGRMVGGKPVEGVGWVFVARTPVRGVVSRRSQQTARGKTRRTKTDKTAEAKAIEAEVAARRAGGRSTAATAEPAAPKRSRRRGGAKAAAADAVKEAIEEAAAEVSSDGGEAAGDDGGRRRRRRTAGPKAVDAVNSPTAFLTFVTTHGVGSEVDAVVDRFSSHGAYVTIGDVQGYVPLRNMADPPPPQRP